MPGHEIKSKIIVLNWGLCYELGHGVGVGGSKARLGCRSVHAKRLNNHEDPWKDVNPIYAKHQCCVLLCCCFQIQRTKENTLSQTYILCWPKGVNQDSVRQRTTQSKLETESDLSDSPPLRITPGQYCPQSHFQFCDLTWPPSWIFIRALYTRRGLD